MKFFLFFGGLLSLLFFSGCTSNQQRRLAEKWAPFEKMHNLKIIRESLSRPSSQFSLKMIPCDEKKSAYLLKANLPIHERFLFATVDRITDAIKLHFEFEVLSDGTFKIFEAQNIRYSASLPLIFHQELVPGKSITPLLVHKKSASSAISVFSPYPIESKGMHQETISLHVTHPMLTRFYLEGGGFIPNESLKLIHRFGGKVETLSLTADNQGSIGVALSPLILGQLGGEATLTIVSQNGSLDLHYLWGGKLENTIAERKGPLSIFLVANHLPHEIDRDPFSLYF